MSKEKIEEIKEGLEELEEALNEAKSIAKHVASLANECDGEIRRAVSGQLKSYLIGQLDNFIENSYQPGSIVSLQNFLEKLD